MVLRLSFLTESEWYKKEEAVLDRTLFIQSKDPHRILRNEILKRLRLGELEEDNLKNLVILSVKLQTSGVSQQNLLNSLQKYDCHQIGLVAKKKALLLLGLEHDLGVTLDDDKAVEAVTVKDLCDLLLKQIGKEKCCV